MSAATLFPADFRTGPSAHSGFAASGASEFDAGDLRAVAFTFVATATLVLFGALGFDYYLASVLNRPVSLDALMTYRLAADMLPWACSFTLIAALALVTGLAMLPRKTARNTAATMAGFSAGAAKAYR